MRSERRPNRKRRNACVEFGLDTNFELERERRNRHSYLYINDIVRRKT